MDLKFAILPALALLSFGCSNDTDYEHEVVTGMHQAFLSDVEALHQAAVDLQKAAPSPKGRGWDADEDADAISAMKEAWLAARSAYERTEGALAPLFPDLDAAIDARYDDFLTKLAGAGDQDLFDTEGVTGMHAIERILFVKTTPDTVIQVEKSLPGYKAAAWPATEEEANEFKTELAVQLVKDTKELRDSWQPQKIDLPGAYEGLKALMIEQREKVRKAASEEEESRYAQRTMADIRDNLAGTRKAYGLFKPWLETKPGGADIVASVEKGFDSLAEAYATVKGDAFPQPPSTWSSENPSEEDLQTPFGKLFTLVQDAVDPNKKGSVADGMAKTAEALDIPIPGQ
jgi:iron uptake system component EfeO